MSTIQQNIKVVVRVRPYNKKELEQNQRCVVKVMDNSTILFDPDEEDDEFFFQGTKQNYRDMTKRVNKKLAMEFDRVYDTEASNDDIFLECTSPLVDAVLNGYNCSVFVYGATGAGKTYTMLGCDSCPGLTYLTMSDLFQKIEEKSNISKFDVGVSYLEVYNENVMNLLTKSGPLKLREDSHGVVVSGLTLKPIKSAPELLNLLRIGNSHRTQHPTDANSESSRSHAIFQVHIRMTDRKTGTKRTVKLSMIDLAGSERAASTKGIGLRFKEGASINKSLLALGNCINKLADGLKHIPYRDSNLTRILKDSLGGNCQTLMVANLSQSSLTYEDTYNTLKYASRAKKIRTTLRQNEMKSNMPKDFYIKQVNELMVEVERLKEKNKTLETKVAQMQKSATTPTHTYDENELKPWYSKIDAVYSVVIKTQEYIMGLQSKIKNCNFRMKHKEEIEVFKKKLCLNQTILKEDFIQYTASMSKLNKEIEKQNDELMRWRKKLKDACIDLEKLKKEIKESKHSNILHIYQRSKDLEIKNSKQNINVNHVVSINTEFENFTEKLRKAFSKSCEMLQSKCSQSNTNENPTMDISQQTEQLLEFLRSDNVSYKDIKRENEIGEADSAIKKKRSKRVKHCYNNNSDLGLEDIIEDTDSDSGSTEFKMPQPRLQRNPNETQVLSSTDDDNNTTFDISSSTSSQSTASDHVKKIRNNNYVANILSDQITKVPSNADQLKSMLIKSNTFSHQKLSNTVKYGVLKENKELYGNRIRKSPRALMSKALASTSNFVKKQVTGSGSHEPIVRTNRAASFRIKK